MTRIDNYEDVMETLGEMTHLMPSGEQRRVEVENPRLNNRKPDYLRVKVPRKMMTFKVIRKADEMGLKVDDIWQLDQEYENEMLYFKLVPKEDN